MSDYSLSPVDAAVRDRLEGVATAMDPATSLGSWMRSGSHLVGIAPRSVPECRFRRRLDGCIASGSTGRVARQPIWSLVGSHALGRA